MCECSNGRLYSFIPASRWRWLERCAVLINTARNPYDSSKKQASAHLCETGVGLVESVQVRLDFKTSEYRNTTVINRKDAGLCKVQRHTKEDQASKLSG